MNEPIYTVYALENGISAQVAPATSDFDSAVSMAYNYFKETSNKVKVVKSYVQHDVVRNYVPFYVRVQYRDNGSLKAFFFEDRDAFSDLISKLSANCTSYEVKFMCYSF